MSSISSPARAAERRRMTMKGNSFYWLLSVAAVAGGLFGAALALA
jgi:hypothetical protein